MAIIKIANTHVPDTVLSVLYTFTYFDCQSNPRRLQLVSLHFIDKETEVQGG